MESHLRESLNIKESDQTKEKELKKRDKTGNKRKIQTLRKHYF